MKGNCRAGKEHDNWGILVITQQILEPQSGNFSSGKIMGGSSEDGDSARAAEGKGITNMPYSYEVITITHHHFIISFPSISLRDITIPRHEHEHDTIALAPNLHLLRHRQAPKEGQAG